jgi:hypothetical protein
LRFRAPLHRGGVAAAGAGHRCWADIGTSVMLGGVIVRYVWLSPLCIFTGVVMFISRPTTPGALWVLGWA